MKNNGQCDLCENQILLDSRKTNLHSTIRIKIVQNDTGEGVKKALTHHRRSIHIIYSDTETEIFTSDIQNIC